MRPADGHLEVRPVSARGSRPTSRAGNVGTRGGRERGEVGRRRVAFRGEGRAQSEKRRRVAGSGRV